MLADNIREVSYSVKKHKGEPNSGFEMDCPIGNEDWYLALARIYWI
jgi:hypothetical protein